MPIGCPGKRVSLHLLGSRRGQAGQPARQGRHSSVKLVGTVLNVKCTEQVRQQKLAPNGKVERDAQSTYDYLVFLTNAGGELSVNESRLALHEVKADKKNTSLLVTNGFATLFLIFHPYYAGSFEFSAQKPDAIGGREVEKSTFSTFAAGVRPRCWR